MARSINGGTDHIWWTIQPTPPNIGTVSFWMRSTDTTLNTEPLNYYNSTSRNGWGFVWNNTGLVGKVVFQGSGASTNAVSITGSTVINDGNWHHVLATYDRNAAGPNALYIDGVLQGSANSVSSWTPGVATGFILQAGDPVDTFWATYVGHIAEIAHWNANLNADEIKALAKGFPPKTIRPGSLIFYAPLVNDTHDIRGAAVRAISGTTVSNQGKVMGGAV